MKATLLVRHGLTLMELLIVLSILAVMTTIAVQMTEGVVDQARYEASLRGQERIRDAIIGPTGEGRTAAGFIADMGRPPISVTELLNNPTVGSYQLYLFNPDLDGDMVSDFTVSLSSGWRGPYLLPNPGQNNLKDGWGHNYDILPGPPLIIRSRHMPDLAIPLQDYQTGLIKFQVLEENEEGSEVAPTFVEGEEDDSTVRYVVELHWFQVQPVVSEGGEINAVRHLGPVTWTKDNPVCEHNFSSQPIGMMAAVALKREAPPGPSTVRKKSAVAYLNLAPRSTVLKKLILR